MGMRHYGAAIFRHEGETGWSILFTDFPEVASSAEGRETIDESASDALATIIDVYTEDGRPLPEPRGSLDVRAEVPAEAKDGYVAFYAVPEPAPLRVNLSIDQALLTRIDAAADQRGMTRSAFLAHCARKAMDAEKAA